MNSKNSSKPSATDRKPRKREAPKGPPGSTDLDRPLKLSTAQSLASAGLYVRQNVVLSEHRGPEGQRIVDVTDVDVLAIGHAIDFRADVSCVTCKGGSSVSVIHETFALAGVMRYLHARRGYAIFARKATEGHMIALAQQLDVMLLNDDEWQHWLKRISGPHTVPMTYDPAVESAVADRVQRWSDLAPLAQFLRTDYWYFRDYRNIQSIISWLRRFADKLNSGPLARYVVLDAMALFSLSVLQLCEVVNKSGVLRLQETVPTYLFGGVATYRQRRDLLVKVESMLRKKNVMEDGQAMPPLDPTYLPELMEMVLRYCSKPLAAIRVPQHINVMAGLAAAAVAGTAPRETWSGLRESALTEKLALDLIGMVGSAARLPNELVRALVAEPDAAPTRRGSGEPSATVPESPAPSPQAQPGPSQADLLEQAGKLGNE